MAKQSVEEIKAESRGLRGKIVETLVSGATHFEEAEYQLLKFHGSYQQDDRDQRSERRKAKLEKAWSFMVRTKMPSGSMSSKQYLIHDDVANDLGNSTLRLTTRQGIQLHGILIGSLRDTIRTIQGSGLTTSGACGDVVRNTMGPAAPIKDALHLDAEVVAQEISDRYFAKTNAFAQIWLDGEKLDMEKDIEEGKVETEEPIYGKHYLPRKFKIGISVPPCNDVDIFSQDIGLVPHAGADGSVEGYSIYVGGGFGMSHGKIETHPVLAKPLCFVARDKVIDATDAIVGVQRDFGNREDRKQARMKYLIEARGIEWFRKEVESRLGFATEDVRETEFETVADTLGWHEQGDGKLFCCVYISQGRIMDYEGGPAYKAMLREIAEQIACKMRVTPNTNILFYDLEPSQREAVDAILAKHSVPHSDGFTELRKVAHACVSMPTCGLALAESERIFNGVLDKVDDVLRKLKLEKEPILVRMTGCPNGCARPYNCDFGFVGRGPNKYAMFVGGAITGDRLAGLEKKVVLLDDIPSEMRVYLEDFAKGRQEGETFSKWWGRTRTNGAAPHPEQFHIELAEREAAKAI